MPIVIKDLGYGVNMSFVTNKCAPNYLSGQQKLLPVLFAQDKILALFVCC